MQIPAPIDVTMLLAAYDARCDKDARAAYLWELPPEESERLARALARRHLGRPVELTCADLGLAPLLLIDEHAALRLVAAVCARARLDAQKLPDAGAWLAELQRSRPRSVRIMATT
jgi:hypothetical protein